jgi:NAD+ synthase
MDEQQLIANDLGVTASLDVEAEIEHRVAFLVELLAETSATTLILGISGGVDSATAGALCVRAAERSRELGHPAQFVAVRLPYSRQADDDDAQLVLDTLQPDRLLTVDVQPASDAALAALETAGLTFSSDAQRDFVLGNIKARQRMIAQYAIAGAMSGLVIGTDHAAEAITGFFTKYGDGGVDAVPLSGLSKRQVRALAERLGLPEKIVHKTPTADLHSLTPQRPDEDELGISYAAIDDFLEGRPVDPEVRDALLQRYRATAHKRAVPVGPIRRAG